MQQSCKCDEAEAGHPRKFRSSVPASGFMRQSNTNMTKKQARQLQDDGVIPHPTQLTIDPASPPEVSWRIYPSLSKPSGTLVQAVIIRMAILKGQFRL
jgi:hypothetical protein